MKKLFCFFCVLFLFVILFNICYAETNVIDENIPGNPPETVTVLMYGGTTTEIIDEGIPQSIPAVLDVTDEEIPYGGELPDTGGVPPEAFYLIGAVFIVIGILFSLKKNKNASVKN